MWYSNLEITVWSRLRSVLLLMKCCVDTHVCTCILAYIFCRKFVAEELTLNIKYSSFIIYNNYKKHHYMKCFAFIKVKYI